MSDKKVKKSGSKASSGGPAKKKWIHPPQALLRGYIVYPGRFLGCTDVESNKGNEIVREAIKKLKFSAHIKQSEGIKLPKVEVAISWQCIKIQEPKTKLLLHSISLKRVSYCADDKQDNRIFAFIAKDSDKRQGHTCYVVDTDKLADEITMTVGQAFDLAYKQFSSGNSVELKKKMSSMEMKVQQSESEKDQLRKRIAELEMQKDKTQVEALSLQQKMQELSVSETWQPQQQSQPAQAQPQANFADFGSAFGAAAPAPAPMPGLGPAPPPQQSAAQQQAANQQRIASLLSFDESDFISSPSAAAAVKYEQTQDLDSAISDIEKQLEQLQGEVQDFSMAEGFSTDPFSS
ncbi:PTB domain-containing engulfment adapter protein 1-like isoform X2 [Oscarella lobularis]|uniref:PTB domain-containing engulfment adapter protein 1-like isoform X2 n=1 Tax=Oscarella lobularis TaxID=121494 RepID=UPI0033134671